MQLTEKTIIGRSHPQWAECDRLTFLSKNLYNSCLYDVRQHYFATKKYKTWQAQRKDFVASDQSDYRALPAKVAGETVMLAGRAFTSFFGVLKKKRGAEKKGSTIRLPRYLDSKTGRQVLTFPKDTISPKSQSAIDSRGRKLYHHTACTTSLRFEVVSRQESLDMIRIVPRGDHFVIECVYTVDDKPLLEDNGRYASIDLGVNNLVTVVSNVAEPVVLGGGAIKSLNQYYNKKRAKLAGQLPKGVYWSRRMQQLTDKRERKLDWELHQVANQVVNHLVSNSVHTLVVGYNEGWKQDIRMGRRNNQSFVSIPFSRLVGLIRYRCERLGISFVVTEESYTSRCSALDGEGLGRHEDYAGRRVRRGLFEASDGRRLNADVNGAWNILRKVVPDRRLEGIEGLAIGPVCKMKIERTKSLLSV